MRRLVVGALVGLLLERCSAALAAEATAEEAREACASGAFFVAGEPLLPAAGALAADQVILENGTVAIASGCAATPARIRAKPWGTVVRARWAECEGAARVRLVALIDPSCRLMAGRFVTRRPRSERAFVAVACTDAEQCPSRLCRGNDDCAADSYCAREPRTCEGAGHCQPRPAACPDVYDPVCGCDGTTYGNECEAAAAGTSVSHPGECVARCGTIAGIPCADSQFCELPTGTCDSADLEGRCVAVPEACPEIYDPVCGCDGTTYGNDCERRMALAQKAHAGACRECRTACDCLGLPFENECPLMCPMCGSYWTCEASRCVERCGIIPPDPCTAK